MAAEQAVTLAISQLMEAGQAARLRRIGRAGDDVLDAWLEALEDDDTEEGYELYRMIEGEIDGRDAWRHEDPRVRESVGNYGGVER